MQNKTTTLTNITRFLGGFLVSILVVAIFLKVFNDFLWAALLGAVINGGVSYYILTKYSQNQSLKMTAYGALTGMTLIIVTIISVWIFVDAAFQGLAD